MKPAFRITINRQELTQAVIDRVLEVRIEDSAGYDNDNCLIKLDGRAPFLKFPKTGAIAEVSLGYEDMPNSAHALASDRLTVGLTTLGRYSLGEIDFDGPPWTLELNFTAMSMESFPKTAQNDTHENTTLGAIVKKLARRMGYTPDVHPSFDSIQIAFEQQKNVTDMEFINFLAQRYGAFPKVGIATDPASVKVINNTLRFHPKDGANFVDEYLEVQQCFPGSINFHTHVRSVYGQIQAATFSYDTGELLRVATDVNVPETSGLPVVMELSRLYDTAEKARAAAEAKREFLDAEKNTLTFKTGGNPRFQSHRKLSLIGDGWHPDIPRKWIIVSSTHSFTKGADGETGYTTTVRCQLLLGGVEDSDNPQNALPTTVVGQ